MAAGLGPRNHATPSGSGRKCLFLTRPRPEWAPLTEEQMQGFTLTPLPTKAGDVVFFEAMCRTLHCPTFPALSAEFSTSPIIGSPKAIIASAISPTSGRTFPPISSASRARAMSFVSEQKHVAAVLFVRDSHWGEMISNSQAASDAPFRASDFKSHIVRR